MNNKIEKFIYVDLNALDGNKITLTGTAIEKQVIDIYKNIDDGMEVFLWTDDANENNKYDPLVYTGKVGFDQLKNIWFIEIDLKKLEHLSSSEQFKDYSLEDILGKDTYENEKKNHPELF